MYVILPLFLLIGLVAGAIGSLAGIGGGMFFVPALLFLVNIQEPSTMTPQIATGTSLVVIAITALSSTLAYVKQKKVDIPAALLFFIGSAPGAVAGVYLNKMLQAQSFYLLFGLFQIAMFTLMMVRDKLKPIGNGNWQMTRTYTDSEGVEHRYGYNRTSAVMIAFFVGVTSSLFGVGGGVLMVPALLILYRFPPHMATATSMFVIFLSAVVGSLTNVVNDQVHWLYVLALAPGAWFGGKLGAYIATRLKGKTIISIFRIIILLIAIQMIFKSFAS